MPCKTIWYCSNILGIPSQPMDPFWCPLSTMDARATIQRMVFYSHLSKAFIGRNLCNFWIIFRRCLFWSQAFRCRCFCLVHSNYPHQTPSHLKSASTKHTHMPKRPLFHHMAFSKSALEPYNSETLANLWTCGFHRVLRRIRNRWACIQAAFPSSS